MRPPTAPQRRRSPPPPTSSTTVPAQRRSVRSPVTGSTVLPGTTGRRRGRRSAFTIDPAVGRWRADRRRFTCDGAGISPALTWTAPPAGTVELALLTVDDDAGGYVHWAVTGIPPAAGASPRGRRSPAPRRARTLRQLGYGGPCPPPGHPPYRFTLYALDQQPELPAASPARTSRPSPRRPPSPSPRSPAHTPARLTSRPSIRVLRRIGVFRAGVSRTTHSDGGNTRMAWRGTPTEGEMYALSRAAVGPATL